MRHRKIGRKLNRNSSHRKALFKNLSIALIKNEIIKTTLPKAKELRRFLEPLVTIAKSDSVANRRLIFARLRHRESQDKLFNVIAEQSQNRPGGYLRIIKAGYRINDCAPMAYIEFVDRKIFHNKAGSEVIDEPILSDSKDTTKIKDAMPVESGKDVNKDIEDRFEYNSSKEDVISAVINENNLNSTSNSVKSINKP